MNAFTLSLDSKELTSYLDSQLKYFFPDGNNDKNVLSMLVKNSLERTEYCFSRIKSKYFNDGLRTNFNHLNGDQYSMFLFFVSREAFLNSSDLYYQKCSMLNKNLYSIDLFGHISMPDIFLLVHPVGTIIGRGSFENYLVIYQGVTIGGVHSVGSICYPSFKEGVACFSNSTIIGKANIGNNVLIGANALIIGNNIDDNTTIVGSFPNLKSMENKKNVKTDFFIT